ncbi:MAG TPA: PDZ domain-containing protein, partial [Methylomirabilota bacterium]
LIVMTMPLDLAAQTPAAPSLEPIRYTLRFPAPQTHYLEVEATVPTEGRPTVDLLMAVWTPGSYLVREYSRHVESVRAEVGGRPAPVAKTAKNRWRVETGGASVITLRYRVYAREMTVRTNWVDRDFALINGAPTFITLVEEVRRPHDVRLELPPEWQSTATGLPEVPGSSHHYRAADYDTLVDSPVVAGNLSVHAFTAAGRPHLLVNVGDASLWDGPRAAADVKRLVETHAAFWGGLPYEKYVLLNLITEASGGLEHRNSAVLMTSRWKMRTRRGYVDWLSLVSHELFHAWNVKRLRPVELGPFDYEAENYTRSLWVAEGFTSYYGDLLAVRAGVITQDEYLGELGGMIRELQSTPGRLVQSVEEASYDAWIRYYRQDENTPNTTISYYTKGAVIAFLLDAGIRRATGGACSLDTVLRLAHERFGDQRGFTSAEIRALVSEVAGPGLDGWLHRALDTTEELDYDVIGWLGLRLRPEPDRQKAWLGLTLASGRATLKNEGGRLIVAQVRRGTPAFEAGVNAGDEILALGGYRVRPEQWEERLETFNPGDETTMLVARRDRLLTLEVAVGSEPPGIGRLEADPGAPAAQARLAAWLSP